MKSKAEKYVDGIHALEEMRAEIVTHMRKLPQGTGFNQAWKECEAAMYSVDSLIQFFEHVQLEE